MFCIGFVLVRLGILRMGCIVFTAIGGCIKLATRKWLVESTEGMKDVL